MADRKKLDLKLNQPAVLEMLFETPVVGNSSYGEYYLYAVKQGNNEEYNFFAPTELHEQMKGLHKGSKVEITKLAEQKGSKIITKYELKVLLNGNGSNNKMEPGDSNDNYYNLMLQSCRDAVKIQNELGGLMDPKSVAVTLFIARSKLNGNGYGG
jgi:hypothetical protein